MGSTENYSVHIHIHILYTPVCLCSQHEPKSTKHNMQLPPTDILVSWPKANYVDPATQGCRLTIVIILFLSLGFLVVGLRVFTRVHISKSFGLDDVFAMLAMVSFKQKPDTSNYVVSSGKPFLTILVQFRFQRPVMLSSPFSRTRNIMPTGTYGMCLSIRLS